jgi:hypothetical protein
MSFLKSVGPQPPRRADRRATNRHHIEAGLACRIPRRHELRVRWMVWNDHDFARAAVHPAAAGGASGGSVVGAVNGETHPPGRHAEVASPFADAVPEADRGDAKHRRERRATTELASSTHRW